MRLTVTQEHIDAAIALRNKAGYDADHECPVALALKSAGFTKPWVGSLSLKTKSHGKRFQHGPSLRKWIDAFDLFGTVSPKTFTITGLMRKAA